MKVLLAFLILFDISSAQTPAFTHNRFTEHGKTFSQDGSAMVVNCMAKDASMEAVFCGGDVEGVADLLSDKVVCIPPEIDEKRLVDVFLKYSAKHEDMLHGPACRIVSNALQEAYPCRK